MANNNDKVKVTIEANGKDLLKVLEDIKKSFTDLFNMVKGGLKLTVDTNSLKSDLNDAIKSVNSLKKGKEKLILGVDKTTLKANIKGALRSAIEQANKEGLNKKLKIPIDTASAKTSIKQLRDILQKNEVRINTGKAEGDIIRLSTYMNQLASKKVIPQIDTSKAEQAKLSIAELATYMNQLQSKKIKIDISFANKDIVNNLKDIDSLLKSIQKNSNIKLNVNATGRASGGGVQSQLQQYRTLRQEARHFALEAEKAWTVGDKRGFEQNRQNFLVAMKDLADFSRQLGNLSASREAGMYSNMLRSLQQTSPLYNDILNKIKQLKQEQKDFNNLINEGNKKLKQDTPLRTKDNRPGFMQGTLGASAYVIHYLGRSSKGFGSFGEATSQLFTDLGSLGGSVATFVKPLAAAGATIAVFSAALAISTKGLEFFGSTLQRIGSMLYDALKPGIDLYKQQTSAIFSITASLMSNGFIGDKDNGFNNKLSEMPNGLETAMGLSNKLLMKAQIDAETSAFSLQDILSSLQGTLPKLMSLGMTMEEAYQVNKGVAAVAKMIQLTPSQILQETRDLAQGSITSRGSQVAGALNITNADLKKFEGNVDGLYEFLMEKFKQYSELLQKFEDTALGRWQQLEERWQAVGRRLIDGMLPQFKGFFEGLIEMTGKYVSKTGTYLNKFNERVEHLGTDGKPAGAVLNALTGEWEDAETHEVLKKYQFTDEPILELGEPFKELQKVLPEIISYLAEALDYIIDIVENELGISDPIDLAKTAVEFLIDGFVLCIECLAEIIELGYDVYNILKFFEPVLMPVLNIIMLMARGFMLVKKAVSVVIAALRVATAGAREMWNTILGNNDEWSKNEMNVAGKELERTSTNFMDYWEDFKDSGRANSYEDLWNSITDKSNTKNNRIKSFVDKYKNKEIDVKPTDKNSDNVAGKPNVDTDQKKLVQESQKKLKETLAKLKEILSDTLDRLKDLLDKNEVAYKEGFKSITDYLKAKTELERQEAEARLQEAEAELQAIQESEFNSPYDKLKETHKVQREIDKYTKQLSKATTTQVELRRDIGNFVNTFEKATGVLESIMSGTNTNGLQTSKGSVASSANTGDFVMDLAIETAKQIKKITGKDADIGILWGLIADETDRGRSDVFRLNKNPGGITWNPSYPESMKGLARPASEGGNYVNFSDWGQAAKDLAEILMQDRYSGFLDTHNPQEALNILKSGGYMSTNDPRALANYVSLMAEGQDNVAQSNISLTNALVDNTTALTSNTNKINGVFGDGYSPDISGMWGEGRTGHIHSGTDFAVPMRTPIYAPASGVVSRADELDYSGYGKMINLDVDVGNVKQLRFAHLDEMSVDVGQRVEAGQLLGYSGNTGASTGPHLHLEALKVRDSYQNFENTIDPTNIGLKGFAEAIDGATNIALNVAHSNSEAMNNFNLMQESMNKYNDALSDINDNIFGNAPMLSVKLRPLYEQLQKAMRSDNPQDKAMVTAIKTRIDQETNKAITDALNNQLEFNLSRLNTTAQYRATDIAFGKNKYLDTSFYSLARKYYEYIYKPIDTESIKENILKIKKELEKYADIDDTNTEVERLNNELAELENQLMLAKQRPANQIEALKNQFIEATNLGNTTLAENIKSKIFESENKLLEMYESWIDAINKRFDLMGEYFDTIPMTNLQRERGEEELKAYRNRQLNRGYRASLASQQQALSGIRGRKAQIEYGIENRIGDVRKLRAEYSLLIEDEERWRQKILETTQRIRISDELSKLPSLLEKTRDVAKQALEDGLVTFLTDGVNEAESLGEALRNLATDFLKTMQEFFAKQLVTDFMNALFPPKTKEKERLTTENLYPGDYSPVVSSVTTGSNAIVNAIHSLQYALTGTGQGLTSDYVKTNIIARKGLNEPYQNSFTLDALKNSKFGTNNHSFDYASLGLQKLGESANNAGQTALPSFTSGLTDSMNSITNTTTTSVTSFIDSQLTNSLTQLATNAQNAANALSMLSNMGGSTGHATGGYISGPGTSTSDSIPAMLSNGEFVLRSDAVRRYGTNFLNALNEGKLSKIKSRLPHFASGGMISDVAQDSTIRGVSNFGKSMASNINNVNNFSVALVRDEKEGMRELLKSAEGQRLLLDFSKKYARFTSIL